VIVPFNISESLLIKSSPEQIDNYEHPYQDGENDPADPNGFQELFGIFITWDILHRIHIIKMLIIEILILIKINKIKA